MTAVENVAFAWFFQPPLSGDPGLLMVRDQHPGPERPDIAFVLEKLNDVLLDVESRIPKELNLFQFKIYVRDVFGVWAEIKFTALSRQYQITIPEAAQGDLETLWESREDAPGGSPA